MNITVISPLFPPDTGAPAPYVKLLISKLSLANTINLISLGYLPETVPKVTFNTIDKRDSKIFIITRLVYQIIKAKNKTDLFIINNGPLIELPILFCLWFINKPIIFCISDTRALKYSNKGVYRLFHNLLKKHVLNTIYLPEDELKYLPPEILPFNKIDENIIKQQETWWLKHIEEITSYGKK